MVYMCKRNISISWFVSNEICKNKDKNWELKWLIKTIIEKWTPCNTEVENTRTFPKGMFAPAKFSPAKEFEIWST